MATLTGWQVACYRAGIGALFLWLVMPEARRNWSWRTLSGGVVYAAVMITFVLSTKLTTAANAILLQSTAPIYLLLLGPFFLKEKLKTVDVVVVAGVLTGAAVLVSGNEHAATAPDPVRGNLIALGSGVAWALTIAVLRWMGKRDASANSAASVAIAGNIIAFVCCLPLAAGGPAADVKAWAVVAYLGIFQVGLAYVFLTRAIRETPAIEASTLLLMQPVLTPVWTWLINDEVPSGRALAGGAVILTAAFFGSWWQAKAEAQSSLQ